MTTAVGLVTCVVDAAVVAVVLTARDDPTRVVAGTDSASRKAVPMSEDYHPMYENGFVAVEP